MITSTGYNSCLDLKDVKNPFIENIQVLKREKYARGVRTDFRLDLLFTTYYDQKAKQFLTDYFMQKPNTLELIVTNEDTPTIVYEKFLDDGRQLFRVNDNFVKSLTREVAADCRTSIDINIIISNGITYKVDVFDREFFSIAYLCKTYMIQTEETGNTLTPLAVGMLDGWFLSHAGIEYNKTLIPTQYNCQSVARLIGPVALKNSEVVIDRKINTSLLKLAVKELVKLSEPVVKDTKEEKEDDMIESITVNQLTTNSFKSGGYHEVSDLENLKGENKETLPIVQMYVCGDDNAIYIEVKIPIEGQDEKLFDTDYILMCLDKFYGILPAEIYTL